MPEGHDIDIRKNVQFGVHDGEMLTGDYYAPPGIGPYPALVAVHGGGWQLGTAESYQSWGPYLAHHGYVLFAINYRLVHGTKNRYPAAVHVTPAPLCNFSGAKRRHSRSIPTGSGAWQNLWARIWPHSWPWQATAARSLTRIPTIRMPACVPKSRSWWGSMVSMICWPNGVMTN
jgi:hypothetical protein